ncbi:MAG: hypothetical protein OEZ06_03640 [Myxococcales bacterium]|nr:hypothetical protein [Myxococcales bacterium]
MPSIANCSIPDDLFYHVENNTWLRDCGNDVFELGMTDIAQSLAGAVIHCRIKKAGKGVKEGKSLATVESGKWVGPVKAPFACEIVERNEAVEQDASLLNKSPYERGWIARIKPADPAAARASLLDAASAVPGFEEYMKQHGITECTHCEGCDLP